MTLEARRRLAALVALLALGLAQTLRADELRLRNGDRLTGTVKRLSGGTLTFDTPHGELQVPWDAVGFLSVEREMIVTVAGAEPRRMSIAPGTADFPALADIISIEPPPGGLAFAGGANAGFVATGGNTDVNSLRLDGELVARRPVDRYTMSAVVNRLEDAGRETARNATTAFKYDRFLTERLFANGSAIFTNDKFRGLDLRTALGGGIGYQVWDTPRAKLAVDGGFGYVREDLANGLDDDYSAARESAKLDVFFAGERIQAFHYHDGYFGLTGDDNLFFRTQNGVRLSVAGGLVTTVQVDVDYDRSPAPERANTDRTVALTFGYRF